MIFTFQRRHPSSETVMLYRLFLQEDKTNFEKEKSDVQSGKSECSYMCFLSKVIFN